MVRKEVVAANNMVRNLLRDEDGHLILSLERIHSRLELEFLMQLGVFIPIGNNGWLISTTSPQYKPSFDLNNAIVQKAEQFNFDFALSMIKLHGFGGPSQFWDYNLESFTLMAGLAATTKKIKLFATCAVLSMPPPIAARMAVTVDSISHGRFGVNIISGWQRREYTQMGIWPGAEHYKRRYEYCAEYVTVMNELWGNRAVGLQGRLLQDGRLPLPADADGGENPDHLRRPERRRDKIRGEVCRLQFLRQLRLQPADSDQPPASPVWSRRPRNPAGTAAR